MELAKEAVLTVLKYGFTELNLNRIEALVLPENAASQHLLDRLGFPQEGLLRQYEKTRGQFDDLYMHFLFQTEWQDGSMHNKNTSIECDVLHTFLTSWRKRIIAVRILIADLPFLIVNDQLNLLILRNFPSCCDGFFLCRKPFRCF